MVEINFIDHTGERHQVQATVGMTVMEAAVQNRVPGIDAECGGACACATCHVYIEPDWQEAVGPAERMEEDMLDFAFDVRPNSRLSCQIKVTEALNGLVLRTPERQG
jgi:2Fe-2S ferredoxin